MGELAKGPDVPDEKDLGRGADGRFLPGSQWGKLSSRLIVTRKLLGIPVDADDEIYRDTRSLYLQVLKEFPSRRYTAMLRQQVAVFARNSVMAAHYANKSRAQGHETRRGIACAKQAAVCDQRAESAAKMIQAMGEALREQPKEAIREPMAEFDED